MKFIMHISATDNFDFGNQEKLVSMMETFIAEQSSIFYGISYTIRIIAVILRHSLLV